MTLRVCEIFQSIQGESSYAGLPCAFIRLTGCNLRCVYCDSKYAYHDGTEMSVDEVVERIASYGLPLVEITGGEPLIQEEVPSLASRLLQQGFDVLVETNGSQDISLLPEGVVRIVDVKCPSSGESDRIRWENLWQLRPGDEVKFVISNRHDYEWVSGIVRERFGHSPITVLFSAVYGELPPGLLVEWILQDKLPVRFQIQIHKYVWPHERRGV